MSSKNQLGVLAVQRAVANASPSFWRDLIVVGRAGDSLQAISLDGTRYALQTSARAEAGEPIAIHPIAEILAIGSELLAVRVSPAG